MARTFCNISCFFFFALCALFPGCQSGLHSLPADSVKPPVPPRELSNTIIPLDQSPLDILYYPPEYPKLKMMGEITSGPVFRVIYSRPQKNGRTIFGSLVKYNEAWRLGANEATEIEFFEPVVIQEKKVPKGRYMLYCIAQPSEWTLVLNSDLYTWGLKADSTRDVFRFVVPTMPAVPSIEVFTMETERGEHGEALLWIGWDDTKVVLPIWPGLQ